MRVDWIDDAGEGPVRMPAAMAGFRDRRTLLADLAGRALGGPVAIRHREGFAPRLPDDAVRVSCASREGLAAAAIARGPVGIDVEAVVAINPPYMVLHPDEARFLRALLPDKVPRGFARLWAVKEAYLKALRRGLSREPSTFSVTLLADGARIDDPGQGGALVETRWVSRGVREWAVAVVLLPSPEWERGRG
jgi:phosphopantetheinyl transferase